MPTRNAKLEPFAGASGAQLTDPPIAAYSRTQQLAIALIGWAQSSRRLEREGSCAGPGTVRAQKVSQSAQRWVHAREIPLNPPVPSLLSHTAVTVCHTFVSNCSRGCIVLHITDVIMTGREYFTGVGGASC